MALKPNTIADVKARAAAKRAAAKATATPEPAPAVTAPAADDGTANGPDGPAPDGFPNTLADVANATGLTGTRINGYRRAGSLDAATYQKSGRAYFYSDVAIQTLKSLQADGVAIARRTPKPNGATEPPVDSNATATAAPVSRGRKAGGGGSGDVLAALDAAIAAAEAEAKRNSELATSLKSQRKTFGR